MHSIFAVLAVAIVMGGWGHSSYAQSLKPVAPVYLEGPNYTVTLKGWTQAPVSHSSNRIIYRKDGYRFARMLTISEAATRPDQFEEAVRKALTREAVTDVKFLEVREIDGPVANAFRKEANIPDGTFKAWIVSGNANGESIKGAGFSVISAQSTDPGTSVEVFLALTDEYEHMGGIMVPMGRLFKVSLTDPKNELLSTGRAPDDDAVDAMAAQFEQFMFNIVRGRILSGMAQQQTLTIMQGLDQANDYGLQDPIYDLGK